MQNQAGEKAYLEENKLLAFVKSKYFLALSVLLFLGSVGGLIIYPAIVERNQPAPMPKPPIPILPPQTEKILLADSPELFRQQVWDAINSKYAPGDLAYFPLKKQKETGISYLGAQEFLSMLKSNAPGNVTSFIKDGFFLGVLNTDRNHPVVIFEILKDRHENIFAGMLAWEKNLLKDFSFMRKSGDIAGPGILFEDILVENNHSRVAQNNGSTILIYVILNKQFLIITDSPIILEGLISRFVNYKFS